MLFKVPHDASKNLMNGSSSGLKKAAGGVAQLRTWLPQRACRYGAI